MKRISSRLFGQNIEHTRLAITGGLSAQLLRNRKFAGKPQPNGLAHGWEAVGASALFSTHWEGAYTRHFDGDRRNRHNDSMFQMIQNLEPSQTVGIQQAHLPFVCGMGYGVRLVMRILSGGRCVVTASVEGIASHDWTLEDDSWRTYEWHFTSALTADAAFRIAFSGEHAVAVGAASLMPDDNFRGMRRDVVRQLARLKPGLIRWPGGNFAGDYRWQDMFLDRDMRAPLQSYMEQETQPYTQGFDDNDIDTDDVAALCREVGAEPFFTLNLGHESPETSADWVEYCNGGVETNMGKLRAERGFSESYGARLWSLGNEFGYAHMEGPNYLTEYLDAARKHGEAVLAVSPELELVCSGLYPRRYWVDDCAAKLRDVAGMVALHHYVDPVFMDFTSAARTRQTLERVWRQTDEFVDKITELRDMLPDGLAISFDEWNLWYAWFMGAFPFGGLMTFKLYHAILRNQEALKVNVVCYFQLFNEGGMVITPRSCRLTGFGDGIRLMSGHIGGCPVMLAEPSADVFVSEHGDGHYYVTLYNESLDGEKAFVIPVRKPGECSCECLAAPDGDFRPGHFLQRVPCDVRSGGDAVCVTLPPGTIAAVTVGRQDC